MPVTFAGDIKPYFSTCYRKHMMFMFDLWSADDAKNNWQAIYESVQNKRMPRSGCPEGVWDDTKRNEFLTKFTAWKNDGFQP